MSEAHHPIPDMNPASDEKRAGAIWGTFIGDALAMPVHWYYDRAALRRDYGVVRDYLAPRNPHPDSILWRCMWPPVVAMIWAGT
jgi:ADP-ribosyl-[dinitrogen reductase] hydrolase